jgi:two-component system LytT family response regulator
VEGNREIPVLILEDDALSCAQLKDLLNDHFPQVRIAGIASTILDAGTMLKSLSIDLLFLDIELPDGKGFDLLATLPEVNFEVIVTTSQSTYAIDAIRYSALDYLIKPINLKDLTNALDRFTRRLAKKQTRSSQFAHDWSLFHRLPLTSAEGIIFINTDDVIHVEAEGSYTVFYLPADKKIMVSKPLCDFEDRLVRRNFFRIHNSHIINLGKVSKYIRGEGGYVIMTNNASIPVSRSRKEEFLNLVGL